MCEWCGRGRDLKARFPQTFDRHSKSRATDKLVNPASKESLQGSKGKGNQGTEKLKATKLGLAWSVS